MSEQKKKESDTGFQQRDPDGTYRKDITVVTCSLVLGMELMVIFAICYAGWYHITGCSSNKSHPKTLATRYSDTAACTGQDDAAV